MSQVKEEDVLVDVRDLDVYFHIEQGIVKAVDGVSFQIEKDSTPICAEIRVVKNRKTILGPAANKIWSMF